MSFALNVVARGSHASLAEVEEKADMDKNGLDALELLRALRMLDSEHEYTSEQIAALMCPCIGGCV